MQRLVTQRVKKQKSREQQCRDRPRNALAAVWGQGTFREGDRALALVIPGKAQVASARGKRK
eukprot:9163140-Lingulodinium_polyedra.AAC.1